MSVALALAAALGAWALWQRLEWVRWAPTAQRLLDGLVGQLKTMPFDALVNAAGLGHEVREEIVDGHRFVLGWQAGRVGRLRALDREGRPRAADEPAAQDEHAVAVRCFVDFSYPLGSRLVRLGHSCEFVRGHEAEGVAQSTDAGPFQWHTADPASGIELTTPWSRPAAFAGAALFLALLARSATMAGGPELGWDPGQHYWILAALLGLAALVTAITRRSRQLVVWSDGFRHARRSVPRAEVVAVRRYSDLSFKGVRVDLRDGDWLAIDAGEHDPAEVMLAFRRRDFPVD